MNNSSLHTLVNFRASRQLVEAFDNVCLLSGKTRTQVLAEMMRQRVTTVGSKLPARLASQQAIDERLKAAVEPIFERALAGTDLRNPARRGTCYPPLEPSGRFPKFSDFEPEKAS